MVERCGESMFEAGALEVLVAKNDAERERLWAGRRELSYSLRRKANHKLSEDVVVPRSQMTPLLDHCQRLAEAESIIIPTSFAPINDLDVKVPETTEVLGDLLMICGGLLAFGFTLSCNKIDLKWVKLGVTK